MNLQPWLADAWRPLLGALDRQRLHHGLLFAAPAGYGKRMLVEALATAALCRAREPGTDACGRCRACVLFAAGTHPDLLRIGLELRDDGKQRSEIIIDQMRALGQRLALASQFGGAQVAIIDPADRLNGAAANALLKTLEEPSTGTLILLVADDAARLPATIRSRCQRVEVHAPARDEALQWLRGQGVAEPESALDAALGNPGLALAWHGDGSLALRRECIDDLEALGRGRRMPLDVAEAWAGDRADVRLWLAGAIARDQARRLAEGGSLTAREEIPKLNAWYVRANQARALLATTVRADLVLLDVLRAWPAAART